MPKQKENASRYEAGFRVYCQLSYSVLIYVSYLDGSCSLESERCVCLDDKFVVQFSRGVIGETKLDDIFDLCHQLV